MFIVLRTVIWSWTAAPRQRAPGPHRRRATRSASSCTLPKRYAEEIRDTSRASRPSTYANWFGAKDPKNEKRLLRHDRGRARGSAQRLQRDRGARRSGHGLEGESPRARWSATRWPRRRAGRSATRSRCAAPSTRATGSSTFRASTPRRERHGGSLDALVPLGVLERVGGCRGGAIRSAGWWRGSPIPGARPRSAGPSTSASRNATSRRSA